MTHLDTFAFGTFVQMPWTYSLARVFYSDSLDVGFVFRVYEDRIANFDEGRHRHRTAVFKNGYLAIRLQNLAHNTEGRLKDDGFSTVLAL
mmetsp:Transcript_37922/g.32076  ORF Transcript_37922/g.32076 Transcript_37922/m.32076 type:complete len:90 (+) Transcript_37922:29-298(+)